MSQRRLSFGASSKGLVMRKVLLGAATVVGALSMAASASAATVLITSGHVVTANYFVTLGGTVDGHAIHDKAYESPDLLKVSFDGGPVESLLAFCADIFHDFTSLTPPVTYQTGPLDSNSDSLLSGDGAPLSHIISGEIGYLANLGQVTNDIDRLAGIQGAIWLTEYAGLTITGGSPWTNYYLGLAAQWGVDHPDFAGYAPAMFPVDGKSQGFVLPGVPEPATWGLMLVGFGGMGAMLRANRRRAAAVVA